MFSALNRLTRAVARYGHKRDAVSRRRLAAAQAEAKTWVYVMTPLRKNTPRPR